MYVFYEKRTPNIGVVKGVAHTPTADDRAKPGIDMSHTVIPKPDAPPGMDSILMVNLTTKEFYYDYISPETTSSQIAKLRRDLQVTQKALDDVIMGGVRA